MDKGIYRGGQPSPDGWNELQKMGIKTVVRLDLESEGGNDESVEQVKNSSIQVIDASGPPSKYSERKEAPSSEKIRKAVEALANESNRPVYVHCLHGQDRTGLIVGIYRVLHDHYTKEQAYNEMLDHGFHQNMFPGLVNVWEKFDGKSLSSLDEDEGKH
jgi:protein tyrosine/serine phosphatase